MSAAFIFATVLKKISTIHTRLAAMILLLLSFFCGFVIHAQLGPYAFEKYAIKDKIKTAPAYYIVRIKENCPPAVKSFISLEAKRILYKNIFVIAENVLQKVDDIFIEDKAVAADKWKLSPAAEIIFETKKKQQPFTFYIQTTGSDAIEKLLLKYPALKEKKFSWLRPQHIISIVCSRADIENIFLPNAAITFIDAIVVNHTTELGTPGFDLSANKLNLVQHFYPDITGLGQHVSIKEDYYDTTDIDLKGRLLNSPLASTNVTNHANFMATIIAGAGNSVYYAKGAAWQAGISSASFQQILPDADDYYIQQNISVQNHSYGAGIDNNYGLNALAFDKSVETNPSLLHVFSSGNSGTDAGTEGLYKNIPGYANLTGNFKMAKNIITVGATDSARRLVPLSSCGPAYDGRLKPEIVAFQQNGTSEAAALVSGTVLLMQQYYKQLHQSKLPAALAKAILINTADDMYTAGPDFKTGFGNMNALAAMDLIKANNIFTATVTGGTQQTFNIDVPANTVQLKVTLAWNDVAASPAAPTALVNDVDVEITSTSAGNVWQPWVLNHFPHADSLAMPALRKRDSLNNAEMITIDSPAAGSYKIIVRGYHIPAGSQQCFIALSMDTLKSFRWTRFAKNDFAEAGTQTMIRWQTNFTGNGTDAYSLGDNIWQPISTTTDLTKNYLYWNVPDTIVQAVLRMQINDSYYYSDTFLISKLLAPTTGYICGDSILIYWNKLKNIERYQLYQLGDKYMETFASVMDTMAVLAKNKLPYPFIAVAPVVSNGMVAQKSYAFDYSKQAAGCYISSFYTSRQSNLALLNLTLGTLANVAAVEFEKKEKRGYVTVVSPLLAAGVLQFTAMYGPLTKGINYFRAKITLINGQVIYSTPEAVLYTAPGEYVLFPVPVKSNAALTLLCSAPQNEAFVLHDAAGRTVLQQKIIAVKNNISTSHLQAGIYFYRILKNSNVVFTGRLIIL